MLVRAEVSILIIIDIQEKLVPAVKESARTLHNASLPLTAARTCQVPALLGEQYPDGPCSAVPEISAESGNSTVLRKLRFSCMEEINFRDALICFDHSQAVPADRESGEEQNYGPDALELRQGTDSKYGNGFFRMAGQIGYPCLQITTSTDNKDKAGIIDFIRMPCAIISGLFVPVALLSNTLLTDSSNENLFL